MRSEPDESLMSEDVLCVSEYAEDIYRHLRESEVRNFLNYDHSIISLLFLPILILLYIVCIKCTVAVTYCSSVHSKHITISAFVSNVR